MLQSNDIAAIFVLEIIARQWELYANAQENVFRPPESLERVSDGIKRRRPSFPTLRLGKPLFYLVVTIANGACSASGTETALPVRKLDGGVLIGAAHLEVHFVRAPAVIISRTCATSAHI